jgi:hypothetical protein
MCIEETTWAKPASSRARLMIEYRWALGLEVSPNLTARTDEVIE